MQTLITANLYITSNCHLCELALEVIAAAGIIEQVAIIEISDDSILVDIYGTRIPVLQRTDNLIELDWPFNLESVTQFIEA